MKQKIGYLEVGQGLRLRWALALLLICYSATLWALEATPNAQDPVVEARMIHISEELRCLVCQNESLASSHAELAGDLREEVRGLIRQDKSDTEIKDFLITRYGDFVLYRPAVKPVTWALWFGPFVLLIGALVAAALYLRQRQRLHAPSAWTAEELKKAEQLLKDGESA
jgi:cytochrome c-type biogenesis protein CcmH